MALWDQMVKVSCCGCDIDNQQLNGFPKVKKDVGSRQKRNEMSYVDRVTLRERFRCVLDNLVVPCRTKELEQQCNNFDATVETELNIRLQETQAQLKQEAKNKNFEKELQNTLRQSLNRRSTELETRSAELDQIASFPLHRSDNIVTSPTHTRHKTPKELHKIYQLLTKAIDRHADKMVKEQKVLVARATRLQAREEKFKDALLSQHLGLARRETLVKERESLVKEREEILARSNRGGT
ncbi:hypothetical protein NX059_007277 [Plenodomus lindquistii]|nr:hypothetical protein NX059_007277 [Plenodomus lindquistii]